MIIFKNIYISQTGDPNTLRRPFISPILIPGETLVRMKFIDDQLLFTKSHCH